MTSNTPTETTSKQIKTMKPTTSRKDNKLFTYTSQRYTWTHRQICEESPVDLNESAGEHWRLLLELFKPDDIVWTGGLKGFSRFVMTTTFRTVREWLMETAAPAPFISPSSFKPGSISSCNENIAARRFFVVAVGLLGKDQIGSVYAWLMKEMNLTLRAVVGNDYGPLQAWFDYPAAKVEDKLFNTLAEHDLWPRLIPPTKPCCLPDDEDCRLLYLQKRTAPRRGA